MNSLINCVSSSALGQNVELVDFDEPSRDENVDPLQPSHPELPFEFCGSCRLTSALQCPHDNLTTWARVTSSRAGIFASTEGLPSASTSAVETSPISWLV